MKVTKTLELKHEIIIRTAKAACRLVVNDLPSETKGFWFEFVW